MADKGPDWKAEELKLVIAVENLKVGLIRSQLEIVEAEGRIERSNTNIKSTHKAIADGEKRLEDMIKAHGNLIEGVGNG